MIGRRVQCDEHGSPPEMESGDYVRCAPTRALSEEEKGKWWAKPYWMVCTPNGHVGNLANHAVTEHEDGTITVSPSIVVTGTGGVEYWHGMLEKGVFTTLAPTGRSS